MVCIIVLKGILCIKTYNRHPRKKKRCLWLPLWNFWLFRALSLSAGTTLVANDIFLRKSYHWFSQNSLKCHQCVIYRHNGMGMGAIFQDFTRCTNMKGKGQKSAHTKKGLRWRNQDWQQKNQSQFCLRYLAQDFRTSNRQSLRTGVMFQNMKYAFWWQN